MSKKALCIGNAQYPDSPLRNPANDARNVAERLEALGFSCRLYLDADHRSMDAAIDEFAADLVEAEVGLFFYAGHGLQIKGVNYLNAIDVNNTNEGTVKHSSLSLDKVIDVMEAGNNRTSIIILDACRTNRFDRRWRSGDTEGLASVYAPRGTLIAFATSPGEVALDGDGENGAFTSALLAHIDRQNLPIEDLFKRVRNSLSAATSGEQTSWEHTSLMSDFFFNSSVVVIGEFVSEYSPQAKTDSNFRADNGAIREVIEGLKSYDFTTQNEAVSNLHTIDLKDCNTNELFVLGRNLYQSACGGTYGASFGAEAYLSRLSAILHEHEKAVSFHILNGILYEIYFDSSDRFRKSKKTDRIAAVFNLEGDEFFFPSFQFINQSLKPYYKMLFYIPGSSQQVSVDAVVSLQSDGVFQVDHIVFDGEDVLYDFDGVTLSSNSNLDYRPETTAEEFEKHLASEMAAPINRLVVTYSNLRARTGQLRAPYNCKIQRLSS